jgi:hypothetical protein
VGLSPLSAQPIKPRYRAIFNEECWFNLPLFVFVPQLRPAFARIKKRVDAEKGCLCPEIIHPTMFGSARPGRFYDGRF